ncbi:MAG: EAL domain-containing protein, partial [Myxococcota bacterium]
FEVGDQRISTSAVVGIAASERKYADAEHVVRDASLAAHRARARGRKRRAVFQTQMRVEDTRFMTMFSEMNSAVHGTDLHLHYQPIINLEDGTLSGFEALMRWDHPKLGAVSPEKFIPVAEETGLIVSLGRWVIESACQQVSQWVKRFGQPLHVSVNLSAKQFGDETLTQHVASVLNDTALDPELLTLEITESVVLDNRAQAQSLLAELKTYGVRVSLDDFGTGYSSFSYLHQLPYDTLKIDRSFVARLDHAEPGQSANEIVHAIIVLAHNLRMNVVAEGVEQLAQAETLRHMWCELGQGFYFAKPMSAAATEKLIASRPRWL